MALQVQQLANKAIDKLSSTESHALVTPYKIDRVGNECWIGSLKGAYQLGKPYFSELEQLANTYTWARQYDVSELSKAIAELAQWPLICVGSGGSLTAAQFATTLHQVYTGQVAKVSTPLEAATFPNSLWQRASVMLLSAGGRNPDILGSVKLIAEREPRHSLTMCSIQGSPLIKMAEGKSDNSVFEFKLPSGKDGFLATNSLLAFQILLLRGYQTAYGNQHEALPLLLTELVHPDLSSTAFRAKLKEDCNGLWQKDNFIVLYGPLHVAVAADLESKFSEAALGAVQLADYRNFGHGRHHWLAKREATTGVLALISDNETTLANKTIGHLPKNVPVTTLTTARRDFQATLALFVSALHLVGEAGLARRIDPGRPSVPTFGRKLYHLQAFRSARQPAATTALLKRAIERKTRRNVEALEQSGELAFWCAAFRSFTERLQTASYQTVVFDYDGTLCDSGTQIKSEVGAMLTFLLKNGLHLGIATGRGKSVREDLQQKLPRKYWAQVLIGYYNGAEIAALGAPHGPENTVAPVTELQPIAAALETSAWLARRIHLTKRTLQLTVELITQVEREVVWEAIQQIVYGSGVGNIQIVRSSHSFDILAPGVGKTNLLRQMRTPSLDAAVLCIGDKGQFPGNDYRLLQEAYSLSVDETSTDPETCWNLCPPGLGGAQGTLYYLSLLRLTKGRAHLSLAGQDELFD